MVLLFTRSSEGNGGSSSGGSSGGEIRRSIGAEEAAPDREDHREEEGVWWSCDRRATEREEKFWGRTGKMNEDERIGRVLTLVGLRVMEIRPTSQIRPRKIISPKLLNPNQF